MNLILLPQCAFLPVGGGGINPKASDLILNNGSTANNALWGGGYIKSSLNSINNRISDIDGYIYRISHNLYHDLVYGFEIDFNEPEPNGAIKYIGLNAGFTPAHMNFTSGEFDYGDWKDVWFIKGIKVVLMDSDGQIRKELDKNDYTRDIDGSSIGEPELSSYNVMVGIPFINVGIYNTHDDVYRITFSPFYSRYKYGSYYYNYEAHVDNSNDDCEYFYISAYDTYFNTNDNTLKSQSGKTINSSNKYTVPYLRYCVKNAANNLDSNKIDLENYYHHTLINLLLLLIGKSTDTQEVFGNGVFGTTLSTGTMNDKGLFWGTNSDNTKGVKVFGIENWWGNFGHGVLGIYRYVEDDAYYLYRKDWLKSYISERYNSSAVIISYPYSIFPPLKSTNDTNFGIYYDDSEIEDLFGDNCEYYINFGPEGTNKATYSVNPYGAIWTIEDERYLLLAGIDDSTSTYFTDCYYQDYLGGGDGGNGDGYGITIYIFGTSKNADIITDIGAFSYYDKYICGYSRYRDNIHYETYSLNYINFRFVYYGKTIEY